MTRRRPRCDGCKTLHQKLSKQGSRQRAKTEREEALADLAAAARVEGVILQEQEILRLETLVKELQVDLLKSAAVSSAARKAEEASAKEVEKFVAKVGVTSACLPPYDAARWR